MQEKIIKINNEDSEYSIRDNGTVWSNKRNRELKGTIQRNDYHTVYLCSMQQQGKQSINITPILYMLHHTKTQYHSK